MPRPRRIEVEEGIYHIYNRFVSGLFLFQNKSIVKYFLKTIFETAKIYEVDIIAWMIMSNHFHLIIKIHKKNLSKFLQRYSTNFARFVNKQLGRKGHVFQSRHQSKLIQTDKYFLNVLGYLFYNSVRAGIVKEPFEYKYTNLNDITNPNKNKNYDIIYSYFDGKNRDKARLLFKKWIKNLDTDKNIAYLKSITKGQFVMDFNEKEKIFSKVDRRVENKGTKDKKRKEDFKKNIYSYKDIMELLREVKLTNELWKKKWQSKEKFKLHLKWFLLRKYGNMEYKKIAYLDKISNHSTIVKAIKRIENNKKKYKIILRIQKELGFEK